MFYCLNASRVALCTLDYWWVQCLTFVTFLSSWYCTVHAFSHHSIFIYAFCFRLFVFFSPLPRLPTPHLSWLWYQLPSALSFPPLPQPLSVYIFSGVCSCWSLIPKLNGLWLFLARRRGRHVKVYLVLFLPDSPSSSGSSSIITSDDEQLVLFTVFKGTNARIEVGGVGKNGGDVFRSKRWQDNYLS